MIAPLSTEHGNELFIVGQSPEHIVGCVEGIIGEFVLRRQGHQT